MIFRKNKKAEEMMLKNIVGIVIAVLIIASTAIYIFGKGGDLIIPKPGQKSKASLTRLGLGINKLIKAGEEKGIVTVPAFFLDDDYFLITFNSDKEPMNFDRGFTLQGLSQVGEAQVQRPKKCLNKPCACVCMLHTNEEKMKNACEYDSECYSLREDMSFANNIEKIKGKGLWNIYVCQNNKKIHLKKAFEKDKDLEEFEKECGI